ncbi:MAG: M67 family metallopeptidase [Synechococcus sp. SB0678_bin_12]|uniref:M67 family metallopeptidase n=1 Tax=Synechococcus sp. SB0676_bin_10 TaxID=2604869 RepID=A0A6B1F8M2_9SYNE|nr:M67 family metallopeptidase [Synechococcus sp. SB0664_bin_36]MYF35508.1 M67 family metallopeptidase [Synechococcus sp. SB0678_bin_12]MYG37574.1 M67 family metallopeptidase [Synechococcus sp. SB0676_bin_10]MYI88526.1 M67 family metallopeptidase [Synechococcus sp. SB0672_bin_10]MYK06277.1 M67 family metallopeptidase [Synechococcus sp. SB0670_bin_20]
MAKMPVALQISGQCLVALERSLAVAWPEEGCALLLGRRQARILHLQAVWPCRNVWRPDWPETRQPQDSRSSRDEAGDLEAAHSRSDRFVVDPLELIAAQKYCRNQGVLLLGVAHSHPRGAPLPSAMDQRHAWSQSLVWISAIAGPDSQLTEADRGAWWVSRSGRLQPVCIDVVQTVQADFGKPHPGEQPYYKR